MDVPAVDPKGAENYNAKERKRKKKKKRVESTSMAVKSGSNADKEERGSFGKDTLELRRQSLESSRELNAGIDDATSSDVRFDNEPLTGGKEDKQDISQHDALQDMKAKRMLAVRSYQEEKSLRLAEGAKAENELNVLRARIHTLQSKLQDMSSCSSCCSANVQVSEDIPERTSLQAEDYIEDALNASRNSTDELRARATDAEAAREQAERRATEATETIEKLEVRLHHRNQEFLQLERRLVDAQSVAATVTELQDELQRVHSERLDECRRRASAEKILLDLSQYFQSSDSSDVGNNMTKNSSNSEREDFTDVAEVIMQHVQRVESKAMVESGRAIESMRTNMASSIADIKKECEKAVANANAAADEEVAKAKILAANEVAKAKADAADNVASIKAELEESYRQALTQLEHKLTKDADNVAYTRNVQPDILDGSAWKSGTAALSGGSTGSNGFDRAENSYSPRTNSLTAFSKSRSSRVASSDSFLLAELDTLGLTSSVSTVSLSWWCLDFAHAVSRPPELLLLQGNITESNITDCSWSQGRVSSRTSSSTIKKGAISDESSCTSGSNCHMESAVAEKVSLIDDLRKQLEESSSTCKSLLETVQEQEETIGRLKLSCQDVL